MTVTKFIISTICILTLLTMKGQKGEFELRKELIGPIINNPDSEKTEYRLNIYFQKADSIYDNVDLPPWHCSHNCLHILIRHSDTVLIENNVMNIDEITNEVLQFLVNPQKDPNLSDSNLTQSKAGKDYYISRGLIFIQSDSTLNENDLRTIKAAAKGIFKYKEVLSFSLFQKNYWSLNDEQKEELDLVIDWRLIPSNYIVIPPPPPPPPDSIEIINKEIELDEN